MSNSLSTPPANFLVFNEQQSKNLNIVVDIDGLPLLSAIQVGRYIKYGDPVVYGQTNLIYGGLVPVGFAPGERSQKNLLMLDGGSFTISQRLEPEQGRGSISTLQMTFLDKDSYMTLAVTPGGVVDEILGRQVKIWVGYAPNSWPQEYYVVWRGRVGQVIADIGRITLQFVDPNVVRRQQVFYCGQTELASDIDNATTTIPVIDNGNFFEKILGPDGLTYDSSTVRLFIKIDDEFIEYQQSGQESTGYGSNQFLNVSRGINLTTLLGTDPATPSTAAAHTKSTTVDGYIFLTGHAMDLALKIMLSGWNGPFLSTYTVYSLVNTNDASLPVVNNGIVLPIDVDAIRDLGISVGDYVTVTDSVHGINNGTWVVSGFSDLTNQPNRVVLTTLGPVAGFVASTTATISVRSQYDTLPVNAGCRLPGWEVDIGSFQFYKNTFLSNTENSYAFLLSGPEAGKTFIESEILLPLGAYSLTRQGKISMGLTKPPFADQRTQILSSSNILEPQNIQVQRGINNRKFFNEIDWSFDCDETNTPTSQFNALNTDSLDLIGISSVLPITSRGARTSLGFLNIVDEKDIFIFNRYAKGSVLIDLKTTLEMGNQIEVGDVVVLQDNGALQIPNFSTGVRDIGVQFFEVINRNLDIKSGVTALTLEGGTGASVSDRFATIAPSSLLTAASSASRIVITESFGNQYLTGVFPNNEQKKWTSYVGLKVRVHSYDYSVDGTTTLIGFDPSNNHALLLSPALSFTPLAGYILDLAQYPNNSDSTDQQLVKLIHGYCDPTVAVTGGSSHFVFTVGAGDAAKFLVGAIVGLRNNGYVPPPGVTALPVEAKVTNVSGTTITVDTDLGFVPDSSYYVELIGFSDKGAAYRMV